MRPEPPPAYGLACLRYLLTADVQKRAFDAGKAGHDRCRATVAALPLSPEVRDGRLYLDDGLGTLHQWLSVSILAGLLANLPGHQDLRILDADDWPGLGPTESLWAVKLAGEPARLFSLVGDCGEMTIGRSGDDQALFPADNPRGAARAHVLLAELTACALLPWRP